MCCIQERKHRPPQLSLFLYCHAWEQWTRHQGALWLATCHRVARISRPGHSRTSPDPIWLFSRELNTRLTSNLAQVYSWKSRENDISKTNSTYESRQCILGLHLSFEDSSGTCIWSRKRSLKDSLIWYPLNATCNNLAFLAFLMCIECENDWEFMCWAWQRNISWVSMVSATSRQLEESA